MSVQQSKKDLLVIIIVFLFFSILILYLFDTISIKNKIVNTNNELNNILLIKKNMFVPEKPHFNYIKDIYKEINPYSTTQEYDSGIIIDDKDINSKLKNLIITVINNGYDIYGKKLLKEYEKSGYTGVSLLDLGILGKLSGYNYMSISKQDISDLEGFKVYYTYSPPTVSSSIYKYGYNFTDEDFESVKTDSEFPVSSLVKKTGNSNTDSKLCGHPCLLNGKPDTFVDSKGETKNYMCGSNTFPTLKSPELFAIYKIISK